MPIEFRSLAPELRLDAGDHAARSESPGFGTRSVIASIELQLGGQAEFNWRPEGLVCCLSVPLSQRALAADPVPLREIAIDGNGLRRAERKLGA